MKHTVLIIDGQGGGIGSRIIAELRPALAEYKSISAECEIIAVGSNAQATGAMLRAGADAGATGENAAVYNCAYASIIAGPVGIVMANSMLGEITPKIAEAAASSQAVKILVPFNRCPIIIAGAEEGTLDSYIKKAAGHIIKQLRQLSGNSEKPDKN